MEIYQFHQNQSNMRKRRERFILILAAMKGVQIGQGMEIAAEEFVSDMEQKLIGRLANMKDVPNRYRVEEFVSDMGQNLIRRLAVMKDVPIGHRKKDCVSGTVHHGQKSIAIMRGVPTILSTEEYVLGMVLKLRLANMKDVPTKLSKEACV